MFKNTPLKLVCLWLVSHLEHIIAALVHTVLVSVSPVFELRVCTEQLLIQHAVSENLLTHPEHGHNETECDYAENQSCFTETVPEIVPLDLHLVVQVVVVVNWVVVAVLLANVLPIGESLCIDKVSELAERATKLRVCFSLAQSTNVEVLPSVSGVDEELTLPVDSLLVKFPHNGCSNRRFTCTALVHELSRFLVDTFWID